MPDDGEECRRRNVSPEGGTVTNEIPRCAASRLGLGAVSMAESTTLSVGSLQWITGDEIRPAAYPALTSSRAMTSCSR